MGVAKKRCVIEDCGLISDLDVYFCEADLDRWARSPEFDRSRAAFLSSHPLADRILHTTLADFVRRLAAERRNSQ